MVASEVCDYYLNIFRFCYFTEGIFFFKDHPSFYFQMKPKIAQVILKKKK